MPTVSLPEDPDLGHLRNQARRLQRAARAGDPQALALLAKHHPAASGQAASLPLGAAQHAVARSYGFASWPRLKHHLEAVGPHRWDPADPSTEEAVPDRFARLACLNYDHDSPGRRAEAAALLAAQPGLVDGHIWAAASANDADAVARLLAADRDLARRAGGPYGWAPLFHLAYSRVDPQVAAEPVLRIARMLLDAGADPDEGHLWRGLQTPFTVLTGVFGSGEQGEAIQPRHPHSTALARLLLEAGADPNDAQALYNRMFGSDDDHLELLFEFGLGRGDGGPWHARLPDATESPAELVAGQLAWAISHDQRERVRLLLRHGADVNAPLGDGRTPLQVARLNGAVGIARMLLEAGAAEVQTDAIDRFVAAVMAGDGPLARSTPAAVRDRARRRRPGLIVWAAANGRRDAVRLLLEFGFDVDALGRGDAPLAGRWSTALHEAAGKGDVEMVRLLLDSGADPTVRDTRFDATPLDWARHLDQPATAALLAGSAQ